MSANKSGFIPTNDIEQPTLSLSFSEAAPKAVTPAQRLQELTFQPTSWTNEELLKSKADYNTIASAACLDAASQANNLRQTTIICTIGPKTASVESLIALRKAGMNIMRLNFSHGSYEYHGSVIANLRKSFEVYPGPDVAIALDTKGPEIRTGRMANGDVLLKIGDIVTLHTNRDEWYEKADGQNIFIDYTNILNVVEVGSLIYIDDGLIRLSVQALNPEAGELTCEVLSQGVLSDTKGVNLPGTQVDLPSLSAKDISDLKWGVEQGVDIVFASFIRNGEALSEIRQVLGEKGQGIRIISKIENQQGMDNLDDIITASDGIMVARGDLGIEIPVEKVFVAQKKMVAKCNILGKPVICATQMLESMTFNPRPTRAEVSDVANAVLDGCDAVMLSGESAKGQYPVLAVETMAQICREAERVINHKTYYKQICEIHPDVSQAADTLAASAVSAAFTRKLQAIMVFSESGRTAQYVSKYRPQCPIICVTTSPHTARIMNLSRGIFPVVVKDDFDAEKENWLDFTERKLLEAVSYYKTVQIDGEPEESKQLLHDGDRLVILQGWDGATGHSNLLRLVGI